MQKEKDEVVVGDGGRAEGGGAGGDATEKGEGGATAIPESRSTKYADKPRKVNLVCKRFKESGGWLDLVGRSVGWLAGSNRAQPLPLLFNRVTYGQL